MDYGWRVAERGAGSLRLAVLWGLCRCMFLHLKSAGVRHDSLVDTIRASGHVAVPLASNVGPRSRILNQTCPEPSNAAAELGAFAMYL